MKTLNTFSIAVIILSALSCSKEKPFENSEKASGQVRLFLQQDPATVVVKGDPNQESEALPLLDNFKVEIFNSNAVKIYKKKYLQAKEETIKLNAGEYRLKALHGDSLGFGFGKPFYMADKSFRVKGFVDNGRLPEQVNAVAKLANVKLSVKYGNNISKYYSDYYTIVRHSKHKASSVKFTKNENRSGYIPSGELYLEIYAQLGGGNGLKDSLVYFKSTPTKYLGNDFVTFTVDAPERQGSLNVNITVDKTVEKIEESIVIPASSLPTSSPVFSHNGISADSFEYSFASGAGLQVKDAVLSFMAQGGIESASMTIESAYLTGAAGLPQNINFIGADAAEIKKFKDCGIYWISRQNTKLGCVDFSGAVKLLSKNAPLNTASPVCAKFTVSISDKTGKSATAVFKLSQRPINTSVSVIDYNIWGWKIVEPKADLLNLDGIAPDAEIKLQYSSDGAEWKAVGAKKIEGRKIFFNDIEGLRPGTTYRLRTIFNNDPANVGEETIFTTEQGQQIPNSGFEKYTEQIFTTKIFWGFGATFKVKWWQLYDTEDKWWAVNSPVTLNTEVAAFYQDYKTYPTIALFTEGAYSGNSLMVASIAIADAASEVLYGDTHQGELFIGTANDKNEGEWAKISEGKKFTSRPSALSFMHKFNINDNAPFLVSAEVLAEDGTKIAEGQKQDANGSVAEWTECRIPFTYSVLDKKAAKIKLSFKSSINGTEASRKITVNTISGEHTIHAGSILYLDNIELKYE